MVGAGVAGLQQGRALQKRGVDFHIYEAEPDVGGVWRVTTHLQGAQGKRNCRYNVLHSHQALYFRYVLFCGLNPHLITSSGRFCNLQLHTHITNSQSSPGLKH